MTTYPSTAETNKLLESVNMDEAIESLPDWLKVDVTVATMSKLPNGTYPLMAVHSFAEIAEAYNLDFRHDGEQFVIKRPKTREELESEVRRQTAAKEYSRRVEAEKAEKGQSGQ